MRNIASEDKDRHGFPLRRSDPTPSTLADHGIRLHQERPGEHRCPCPECARSKARPGDTALAVRIDAEGATWVCHRCLWAGALPQPGSERRRERPSPSAVTPPPKARPDFPEAAARLWAGRRPIVPGTVASRYLTGRGCPPPPEDGDLGWHPSVWHHEEQREFPALLALVTDAVTGEPMTVHRTFLAPDGSGKAPIGKPRLLVKGGAKAGGVARLWPDDAVTLGLCIAEGIETALTAALGFGLAWATVDAGNLAAFPVLGGIDALTVVSDRDAAGLRAAESCARRWADAGREVRVWQSPEQGADLNDYVLEGAAA